VEARCFDAVNTEIIHQRAELEARCREWQALAERAVEPNPFYEPWALIPAFEHLAGRDEPRVLFVWVDDSRRELVGVVPIARRFGFHHVPVRYAGLWRHLHCFLATPLIAPGAEGAVWREALRVVSARSRLFDVGGIAADGVAAAALERVIAADHVKYDEGGTILRPLLDPRGSPGGYLEMVVKSKRRRQFDKKRRLLESSGAVRYQTSTSEGELRRWLDDFLELEGRGWKGRDHTALRERANEVLYFRQLIAAGAALGKVVAYRLTAGADLAAMRFDLVTQGAAFALKIAYDERFRRSSPGALLELDILGDMLTQGRYRFVDSCTVPSPHSVHGYFWREERAIGTRILAAPGVAGATVVGAARGLRRMRNLLRGRGPHLPGTTPSRSAEPQPEATSA
jgi:CelD/BcsL family acetyltransferase involved in cellulose biosynthesis